MLFRIHSLTAGLQLLPTSRGKGRIGCPTIVLEKGSSLTSQHAMHVVERICRESRTIGGTPGDATERVNISNPCR